jgi:hypothetical protein
LKISAGDAASAGDWAAAISVRSKALRPIGADGSWVRYVEIKSDGTALRYDTERVADQYGILPEGKWEEAESTVREYGTVAAISAELFQVVWSRDSVHQRR